MSVTTAPATSTFPAGSKPSQVGSPRRWYLRALSTTVTVLIGLVAVLTITIAVGSKTSADGQRVVFGHPVMTIISGSMNPTIPVGDIVVDAPVTAAQASDLHVGQIISFRAAPGSAEFITHRIVAVRVTDGAVSYITKGDANNTADATPRPASDVIGLYNFSIPRGGYVLVAMHTPRVIVMLLASALLWIVAGVCFWIAARPENS
ncbi:MAG TPA: signal peptidase I [Streptosporangiaceae bacterium]|nr:signal peptidase I [Streptosporangiaceae bacterium]